MIEGQRRPQDADPLPHADAELVGIGGLEIVRYDPELIRSRPGGIGGKLREECSETSRRQILRLELDRRLTKARCAVFREQDLTGTELPLEAFLGGVAEQRAVVIAAVSAEEDRALVGVDVVGKADARREVLEVGLAIAVRDIVIHIVERRLDPRIKSEILQGSNRPGRSHERVVLGVRIIIPAQAGIDQEMLAYFPIILREQADLRRLGGQVGIAATKANDARQADVEVLRRVVEEVELRIERA